MFGYSNKIVQEDLLQMAESPFDWKCLNDKTVLVTGATGMLATYITYFLCFLHEKQKINVRVLALCRTKANADRLFQEFIGKGWFEVLSQDICEPLSLTDNIDYIFHLAGNASPYFIKNDPVGIVKSNLIGTFNILEFAKTNAVEKIVFASTREVYGKNEEAVMLSEKDFGMVDPLEDRACYPESKRAAETIMRSYHLQYGIPFNAVRIAHCYGPGMKLKSDGRVMADLLSNVVEGENIVLKSDGSAERAFCYITDAVIAMFAVLIKGTNGDAYNIANETEPITIKDLANMLTSLCKDKELEVIFDIPQTTSTAYCSYKRTGLDTTALEMLGWRPQVSLENGLKRTYKSFQ